MGGQGPAGELPGWWELGMLEPLLLAGAVYLACGGHNKGERVAGDDRCGGKGLTEGELLTVMQKKGRWT